MDAPSYPDDQIEAGRLLFSGSAEFVMGVVDLRGLPPADRVEVCFAGRSNVGKSSLINALTGRAKLARSSAEPGRTRELNYFDIGEGRLFLRPHGGAEREHAYAWQNRGYGGDSVHAFQAHALAHLAGSGPVENTGRAYLANLRIEEAIYQANAEGRRIRLDPPA